MSTKEVKFNYYELVSVRREGDEYVERPFTDAFQLLCSVHDSGREATRYVLKNERVCFIETLNDVQGFCLVGNFATAQHDFRPPVVDTTTLVERTNPRRPIEGDKHRTYFALLSDHSEHPRAVVILQSNGLSGFGINTLRNYLTHLYRVAHPEEHLSLRADAVLASGFLQQLDRIGRAVSLEVTYDKAVIGEHFSQFSDRTDVMREDVTLSIKAKRSKSIIDHVRSVAGSFFGSNDDQIRKIVVKGVDDDHHTMVLNTDLLVKSSVKRIDTISETGELDHGAVIGELRNLAENY